VNEEIYEDLSKDKVCANFSKISPGNELLFGVPKVISEILLLISDVTNPFSIFLYFGRHFRLPLPIFFPKLFPMQKKDFRSSRAAILQKFKFSVKN
jgi:hypothetical protein